MRAILGLKALFRLPSQLISAINQLALGVARAEFLERLQQDFYALLYFAAHSLEGGEGVARGVVELPVFEDRARDPLWGEADAAAAQGDHGVEVLGLELREGLGGLRRDVDAHFGHGLDGEGIHAARFEARADGCDVSAAEVSREAFGHLRSPGVVAADKHNPFHEKDSNR